VTNTVVPDVSEGDIDAWLATLDRLAHLRPKFVVPDRGEPGDARLITMTRRYLMSLRENVAKAMAEGVDLADVANVVDGVDFKSWELFEQRHARNVRAEMLRRESAALRQ
jgi:hypothetical protein